MPPPCSDIIVILDYVPNLVPNKMYCGDFKDTITYLIGSYEWWRMGRDSNPRERDHSSFLNHARVFDSLACRGTNRRLRFRFRKIF
jgi:hypothetical protein